MNQLAGKYGEGFYFGSHWREVLFWLTWCSQGAHMVLSWVTLERSVITPGVIMPHSKMALSSQSPQREQIIIHAYNLDCKD